MIGEHPIKQILIDGREYWDHSGTPANVRENFQKVIDCGTIALGAEVLASDTEVKLVYHRCKSRFCSSCGQSATEEWQEDLNTTLPNVPFVGITLTVPKELRPIFQQNEHLLHDIPVMGAAAIQLAAQARHGASVIIVVITQKAGGFLNFVPHLHVMVSSGGLQESTNRWIKYLGYRQNDIMCGWRYAVIALLSEASRRNVLKSVLSREEVMTLLETQFRRKWHVFIGRPKSKTDHLKHDGRYVRRPSVAQHRLRILGNGYVEYKAKDTRNNRFVWKWYTVQEFIEILKQQVPERGCHMMRYFGLLAPRSKQQRWSALFVLLHQKERPHPRRVSWRRLLIRTFGIDPFRDSSGQPMHWIGRQRMEGL